MVFAVRVFRCGLRLGTSEGASAYVLARVRSTQSEAEEGGNVGAGDASGRRGLIRTPGLASQQEFVSALPSRGVVLEAAGAHYCIVKPALAEEHLPAAVPLVGKAQDNRKEDRERAPRAEANRQACQPHYLLDAGCLGRRDNVFNALEVDVGRVCLSIK